MKRRRIHFFVLLCGAFLSHVLCDVTSTQAVSISSAVPPPDSSPPEPQFLTSSTNFSSQLIRDAPVYRHLSSSRRSTTDTPKYTMDPEFTTVPTPESINCNSSCASNRQRRNMKVPDKFFRRGHSCFCDEDCAEFGDCCSDVLMAQTRPDWQCMETRRSATWIRTTCKTGWDGHVEIRHQCESPSSVIIDPVGNAPVTSRTSKITYKNIFCAVCNDDYEDLSRWVPQLECDEFFPLNPANTMSDDYIRQNLILSEDKRTWGLWHRNQFVACKLGWLAGNLSEAYTCIPLQEECDPEYAGTETERLCHSYLAAVNNDFESFKNVHCAACRNVSISEIKCGLQQYSSMVHARVFSFALLMDISQKNGNVVGKIQRCKEFEIYDPFYKKCRNVICGHPDYVLRNKRCVQVLTNTPSDNETSQANTTDISASVQPPISYSRRFLECPKDYLDPDQYQLFANRSVYISKYDIFFQPGHYIIAEDKRLLFCIFFVNLTQNEIPKFSQNMGYVTAVGLGVSISFLIMHLVVFMIVPDMRNLSGKNLAGLSVCLLVAYLCFVFGELSTSPGDLSCQRLAVVTYYFFLASFLWMNCMAFDVWRTLRMATKKLRVVTGGQWKRFALYLSYVFLVAALIVGITLVFEYSNDVIPLAYRPAFGRHGCWFGHRKALMVFFALPLAIIMILNISLFLATAFILLSTPHISARDAGGNSRRNYKLYIKLSVMMGLTWSTGIFAGYLDQTILWYFFIILNTLQGLFIFVSFSCTKKVGWYLRDVVPVFMRPASFRSSSVHSGSGFNSQSTATSQISRRSSPRSSTNYKHTAPYLAYGNKAATAMDMY